MLAVSSPLFAQGNPTIDSFSKAKKLLLEQVYMEPSDRKTLYCEARFDSQRTLTLARGFSSPKYKNRLAKYETEHVVPAENFGRNFVEWREGHPSCVNAKGKAYKGRKCAEKINLEYRLMQADLYNLFPAIGAVNASRSNYNFAMLNSGQSSFGSCDMRIENRKVQPPASARGQIARSYLYMEASYPKYRMSASQRQLMQAWNQQYPVSRFECKRASIIQRLQGNQNLLLSQLCSRHASY